MPYKDPNKKKERDKQFNQTPQGKKVRIIGQWKYSGLIGDYEEIYDRYINTTNCNLCNIVLCDKNIKCMDHCHITGEFRNIVCNSCNSNKSDRKIPTNNKSGYKNVSYDESKKRWVYNKRFKGNLKCKSSKNKIEILCIKFAGILLYKY